MTEAFKDDFYTSEPGPGQVERPQLELVRGLLPGFVVTKADHEWWDRLPKWRQELYRLPEAADEAERIAQINTLGMTVVRYSAGRPPVRYEPPTEA